MIDHYKVLGLPSGEEGRNLTTREIKKAYKIQALKLHPDKRLSDPNAVAKFQQLQFSYDLLMDDKTRKPFDDFLRQMQSRQEDLQERWQQEERSRQEDLRARQRQKAWSRQEDLQARRRQKAWSREEVRSRQEGLRGRWREAQSREDDLEARLRQENLWYPSREKERKTFIGKVEEEITRFRAWRRANQSN